MPITKQDAYEESISWLSGFVWIGFLVSISQFFLINLIAQGDSDKAIDSNDLKERATRILNTSVCLAMDLRNKKVRFSLTI